MTISDISHSVSTDLINRNELIYLIDHALASGNFRFIQKVSKIWLEKYPNDITFQYYLARSSIYNEEKNEIREILDQICARDPEYIKAWELKLKISTNDIEEQKYIRSILYALGNDFPLNELYDWGKSLRELNQNKDESTFTDEIDNLIKAHEEIIRTPLVGIFHLRNIKNYYYKKGEFRTYAEKYHQRWPGCIAITLWLAETLMSDGNENEAVSLLHTCAVMDPGGEIIRRMWGNNNDFLSMWPPKMAIELTIPIPQQISIPMNWKQLPAGENNQNNEGSIKLKNKKTIFQKITLFNKIKLFPEKNKPKDEPIKKYIENDLDELLKKSISEIDKSNFGKKPVYVVLSVRKNLVKKYGEKSCTILFSELIKLTDSVKLNLGWDAIVFYPDDINCMRQFDLDTLNEIDPWKIKLSLVDLDKSLSIRGQGIGCVLIIGSGDIVPFHSLPNPTDDKDKEVLSDNPYSTLDSNYFVPEWPVGRLVGEKTNDPGLLLKQIRQIIINNKNRSRLSEWQNAIWAWLINLRNPFEFIKGLTHKTFNYGYTASIWRRSSIASFRPIGAGNHLRVTPPFDSSNLDIDLLKKSQFAYFNLHGLPDTPDWYGQKDISEVNQGPDFPIAITASQIKASDSIPSVIFSEACYGGFTEGKEVDDSLVLKFKDVGCKVFIGSTCIAYGSINTPLVGADLLAFIFWKYLLDGYSTGESFMRAKINFAQIMMQRQGYLDGEDQKILLSFVHYGDPLFQPSEGKNVARFTSRTTKLLNVATITDHDFAETKENRISGELISKIKNDLKSYLPGIELAEAKIHPHQQLEKNVISEFGEHIKSKYASAGYMKITYHQLVTLQKMKHEQYIRVTVDKSGKMIKLVTSR